MWGVTRHGDAACFFQTGVSLQLLVGSEPHQLTGDIPQSWSETNTDTGLFWPRRGQRTPESCLQRLHEAQPDLPGLMKFLSEGGLPWKLLTHIQCRRCGLGRGLKGREGGVLGCRTGGEAGVLPCCACEAGLQMCLSRWPLLDHGFPSCWKIGDRGS